MNAFRKLREERLNTAIKPFLARGVTVKRCEQCWLGQKYCICEALAPMRATSSVDIVLLMHRDEILKPTNSGRLIAEVLPDNCLAYQWHRAEPPKDLLDLLANDDRQCVLFFPAKDPAQSLTPAQIQQNTDALGKKITVIVPDGTWREASRMANLSGYLQSLPRVNLAQIKTGQYSVRAACDASRLATAEAVAQLLVELGELEAGTCVSSAFKTFNQHYRAMRDCVPVDARAYLSNA